jgi:hypothetical protein
MKKGITDSEREEGRAGKRGHAEIVRSKVGRLKKARTHSEIVPKREYHQIEAKKKIKARKLIRK